MKKILITGGAGFIGSHLVRHFVNKYPEYIIYNLDKLTYAGNLANLRDIENASNYKFVHHDITDIGAVEEIFSTCGINAVIHLAAESHVDRSIAEPLSFVHTNVLGTVTLLNAALKHWKGREDVRFYHVSTDEVFGSLGPEGYFREDTAYDPRSPYAASKAGSDHLVRAWYHTYKLPVVVSNCSNNYGPYQFPEKLIPLCISNILQKKPLPVYGKGDNIRDWLWVEDHCAAIDLLFHKAEVGSTYNVGGRNEWKNLDLVELLCDLVDEKVGNAAGTSRKLITFVTDRAGHDQRYAIDPTRIEKDFGWKPSVDVREGLSKTIDWYLTHQDWVKDVITGDYQTYYRRQYIERESR